MLRLIVAYLLEAVEEPEPRPILYICIPIHPVIYRFINKSKHSKHSHRIHMEWDGIYSIISLAT